MPTGKEKDYVKEWEIEFSLEPPKSYRELKKFIEAVHPSLNYVIWWMHTYGCNNWRKMHGLPMARNS